jgi:hypothetical protein
MTVSNPHWVDGWLTMEVHDNNHWYLIGCKGDTPQAVNEAMTYLNVLITAYPRYSWAVELLDGLCTIRNLSLHGQWGCRFIPENTTDPNKAVLMYGGEILERFALARDKANDDKIAELKTDARGELICEKG